jgi:SAM-dependent methyltransferase
MTLTCKVCTGREIETVGRVRGRVAGRAFDLAHCRTCRHSFVVDPWTAFDRIYSEAYYRGKGADPCVDYVFELERPTRTVRQYEWRGIIRVISTFVSLSAGTRWLDFGCGNGGLVRAAREAHIDTVGYDTGWITDSAKKEGIPMLGPGELARVGGFFDVVTAIEVIEHAIDPIEMLETIQRLLKPGGVLFMTTGNARPFRGRLGTWRYVIPEIHVSFFEPQTLATALTRVGLTPSYPGFVPGFDQIIRYKVLKNLGVREAQLWERLLPWPLLARAIDARLALSAHPVGRRPDVSHE